MNKNIKIMAVMLIVFGTILVLRFASPEDSWNCEKGEWVKHGNPSSPKPKGDCGKAIADEKNINFDEIGHFVKDGPGFKPGVWYLIYEKLGAPALKAELIFDDKSVCVLGYKRGDCPDIFLPRSSLTRVRGILTQSGAVRVLYAN